MKPLLLLLFTVFFLHGSAISQDEKPMIGFSAGPSLTTMLSSNKLYPNKTPTIHYVAGVSYLNRYNEWLLLKTGLYFEQKGELYSLNADFFTANGQYSDPLLVSPEELQTYERSKYLVVPLLAQFNFSQQPSIFVNAGPFASYLLKATTIWQPNSSHPVITSGDPELNERFSFGLAAGAGAAWPLKKNLLLELEVRNNFGFLYHKIFAAHFLLGLIYQLE